VSGAAVAAPPARDSSEVDSETLSRHEALRVLSERHGLPAVDLSEQVISLSTLRLLPLEIARERSIFAFRVEGDQLMLAMSSPADRELIEELEFVTAKKIQAFVATFPASLKPRTQGEMKSHAPSTKLATFCQRAFLAMSRFAIVNPPPLADRKKRSLRARLRGRGATVSSPAPLTSPMATTVTACVSTARTTTRSATIGSTITALV